MTQPTDLTITLVPLEVSEADKKGNLETLAKKLEVIPTNTDIIVVPELFSTGYICEKEEARKLAEKEDGETIEALKRLSKKHNAAICGSFLSYTGHMLFNRAFFVEPNGEATFYDKRHLFCISEESKVCTRGIKLPPTIRFRRWNITMAVCYDLRFGPWLQNNDCHYDVLIIPANWPNKRAYAWEHLLQARAIENQCFVAGCNKVGVDSFGEYSDSSHIFDYDGKPIGQFTPDYITATISNIELDKYRKYFPVWKDADEIAIKMY